MLDINGAVEAEWPDEGVAAHYGDPVREQRALTEGPVLVDRSNRGVVKVSGPDRLSWLHSLTSQQLEGLAPGRTEQALILSPQGHLEHHLTLTDDGTATWIHVEPHTAKALVDYLDSMRFMLRVEVEDRSGELGVLTLAGPLPAEGGVMYGTGAGAARPARPGGDGGVAAVLDGPFGTDLIAAPDVAARLTAAYPAAGLWAFEAARIAARVPRPGLDTDHKTLPHEVGLIETAVHLNKGCYRGQETVARIHNLGHPPRRLVFLHLDGSVDRLPVHGAPLTLADGTEVGFVGSAARHFELGPIGLGLVKRSVDPAATLLADGIAAAQEVIVAPDAGGNVKVTLRRDSVPPPPSGRRMLLSPRGGRPLEHVSFQCWVARLRGTVGTGGPMLRKALLAAAASERIRHAAMSAPGAQAVVGRYVAGESSEDAVAVARALRSEGLLVTLDYLGEDTTDAQRAAATAAQYVHLVGKLAAEGLTEGGAVEVSVKPTAIGLLLGMDDEGAGAGPRAPVSMTDPAGGRAAGAPGGFGGRQGGGSSPRESGVRIATEHLERIVTAARDAGTTVTVDAEDHRTTQAGLRVAAGLRPRFASLGSVLQAALRRTEADARELAAPGVRVRLCKGAYAEPPSEAYDQRHDIDKSFARCLRILMAGPGYPMIATHDPRLIAITRSLGLARPAGSFEYQMLYGVRPDEQRRLAASGAKVRVYVPYGGDWYPYLVRRLAERPANLALFLRSLGSQS